MLNGTSSVLYGSVPELVEPAKRTRMFGIFYTGTIGAGAVSPALYGLVGDAVGVPTALMVVAGVCLLTLPLALVLRPRCRRRRAKLAPIPQHRLHQRQRRDRRGVGAQDARPERQPHDVGQLRRAPRAPPRRSRLRARSAARSAAGRRPRRPSSAAAWRSAPRRASASAVTGSFTSASSSQNTSSRSGLRAASARANVIGSAISGMRQHAALLGRLDRHWRACARD